MILSDILHIFKKKNEKNILDFSVVASHGLNKYGEKKDKYMNLAWELKKYHLQLVHL